MALYYREDIFKKYNLPVPTTWAQYADDAAKLHAADPKVYITDFTPRNPDSSSGLCGRMAEACSAPAGNPGRCPSITLKPSKLLLTGKI